MQKLLKNMVQRFLFETKKFSKSTSPDYEWIKFTIDKLDKEKYKFTHFFILNQPIHSEIIKQFYELGENLKKTKRLSRYELFKFQNLIPAKCEAPR